MKDNEPLNKEYTMTLLKGGPEFGNSGMGWSQKNAVIDRNNYQTLQSEMALSTASAPGDKGNEPRIDFKIVLNEEDAAMS